MGEHHQPVEIPLFGTLASNLEEAIGKSYPPMEIASGIPQLESGSRITRYERQPGFLSHPHHNRPILGQIEDCAITQRFMTVEDNRHVGAPIGHCP